MGKFLVGRMRGEGMKKVAHSGCATAFGVDI